MPPGAVLAVDEHAWRVWYNETFDGCTHSSYGASGGQRDRADEIAQETWLTAAPGSCAVRSPERQLSELDAGPLCQRPKAQSPTTAEAIKTRAGGGEMGCRRIRVRGSRAAGSNRCRSWLSPQRQEAVLRAKYLDGLSIAEIAGMWNESCKAIESLLSRARQAFRETFEK